MKIFLIIVIILCCVLIGINIKRYFLKRNQFYENLSIFCENLLNEICFNNQKLPLIIENNFGNFNEDFNKLLIFFNELLLDKISKEEFKKKIHKIFSYLNKNEINNFIKFLFSIGTQMKEEEIDKVKNFINFIKIPFNTEREKFKKYSNLYFKLFVALGLVFAIIFI
ncbi:MAG: hypothetical protein IJW32_02540 [Clostridia bacterium]|nr:hypothetical protein [Clostridia bacterium]